MGRLLSASLIAASASTASAASVSYTWDVRNWIVDYQRPAILPRVAPHDIASDAQSNAILANNAYPGPVVEAYEGDTIDVTVVNNVIDAAVAIVWKGVEVKKSPTAQIMQQGGQATYSLLASKAGTYPWHASLPAQAALGLRGALVIRKKNDPDASKYQEERTVVLSDARQRPQVCFDEAGKLDAICPEIEKATWNGQWGDDSKGFPKPVLEVKAGSCYRLRFLGLVTPDAHSFNVKIADHKVEILGANANAAVDSFKVHAGEGVDAVVCANQNPGIFSHDYAITYEYAGPSQTKAFSGIMRYSKPDVERVLARSSSPEAVPFDRSQCEVDYVFDLRNQIVDYLRPTVDLGGKASRKAVGDIPLSNRKNALLINDTYPGPTIRAIEDQLVCVTVLNNMASEPAAIHWHGQYMRGFPAFDGVYGVHQASIPPQGGSMTYRWRANSGTAFYHAHAQALEADRGLKGAIVVQAKNDPHKHLYDEEQVVALSDEWVNPGVCLKQEGGQPGNAVCAEIEKATWTGQWGDGSAEYPWPRVTVESGKCYRLRFIGMMGQAQNFQVTMAGHDMTLIAVDGIDVEPVKVSSFNLHAGERADIVVCANQKPGNYLMSAVYDLATFLENAPAPKMPRVDSSKFWAFLQYKGHDEEPGKATHKLLGGYNAPPGTGGGVSPPAVAGFVWDTNLRASWSKVKNLNVEPEPEKADVTYVLDVGISHPSFKPGETPYATSDPMYMFTEIKSWKKPTSPLLHTKGECGAEGVPFINVPENATTVEVIINNLSPTAHVLHMHGMHFSVINYAPFSESWCSPARFDCFFVPISVAKAIDCPGAILGDKNNDGPGSEYWGCPYKESDQKTQNLQTPLKKDMISLFRRSWAVIRFKVDNPGMWLFHCHMEQHIPTGQIMAFNVLPSKQPPIPKDVPTEGACPVWSDSAAERPRKVEDGFLI